MTLSLSVSHDTTLCNKKWLKQHNIYTKLMQFSPFLDLVTSLGRLRGFACFPARSSILRNTFMPFPTLITYTGFWSWTAVAIFCFLNFLLGFDLVLPFFFWLFKKEKESLKTKIHIKLTETLFRCIFFLKRKIKSVQLRKLQCKINPLAV